MKRRDARSTCFIHICVCGIEMGCVSVVERVGVGGWDVYAIGPSSPHSIIIIKQQQQQHKATDNTTAATGQGTPPPQSRVIGRGV